MSIDCELKKGAIRMISAHSCVARLILVAGLLDGLHAASAQVRVWEGTLPLPTYEEDLPNPNPPFDQYSAKTTYPYTLRDQMTNQIGRAHV